MLYHPLFDRSYQFYQPRFSNNKLFVLPRGYGNDYVVNLNVKHFSAPEITVKVENGTVTVQGIHEEKQDEHRLVSRQFTRKFLIPQEFNLREIRSTLSGDGVLTIVVPKCQNEDLTVIKTTGDSGRVQLSSKY